MPDEIETIDKNPKSWAAWKREAERLQAIIDDMVLAAMDSEPVALDYLQGHKDGLEWAALLAEANHPETGDWLYDDPIELSKAIRKGPDMPPEQPVEDSEPDRNPVLAYADSYRDMAKQGVESVPIWSVITDLERNIAPLYRHARPALVVPKEWTIADAVKFCKETGRQDAGSAMDAWNACRAAMLAAAPQSPGSEPATVPGKWIPVSERMPIEFEAVIAFDGDQVYGEAMYSSDDGFTIDGYDPCDRLNLQNVTHWMPLPAAPQEVK
ncbi:TPA: DUF551 domain-containing protein [Klebsiella pneumoniae subsp. pneumoniae]|nr:DUF551 domain-containing protein [Klebsiella pneumoniae subsp. pneumoniae]